jgi:hypothetical protein
MTVMVRSADELALLGPLCRDDARRAAVRGRTDLNGIDYVEYDSRRRLVQVHFLNDLTDTFGLDTHPERVRIVGGVRITPVRVIRVTGSGSDLKLLEIEVDRSGDFSDYLLTLGWERLPDGSWAHQIPGLDPFLSVALINFRAECPVDVDCRDVSACLSEPVEEPLLDYLARDYASFRSLLLDLVSQRNPDWRERNPSDIGIALLELLAHEGDHLSYFQDAVVNEAYLDTARRRISARRHAKLIDYRMHDGRNARAHVHFTVNAPGIIREGTSLLTRVTLPLRGQTVPPGVVIDAGDLDSDSFETDRALVRVIVYETRTDVNVRVEHNTIYLHTWGNLDCCLGRGTTSASLFSISPTPVGANGTAVRPTLHPGDYLLLEEVIDPATGDPTLADPTHRQVVQLVDVIDSDEDPAYSNQVQNGQPLPWTVGSTNLPLLRVSWRRADALHFPLCLSKLRSGQPPLYNLSVGRGNVSVADHGRRVSEHVDLPGPVAQDTRFTYRMRGAPLTIQCPPSTAPQDCRQAGAPPLPPFFECAVRGARPDVRLAVRFPPGGAEAWMRQDDLLESSPFDAHFVVDLDDDGTGVLRFGDGEYGREVAGATELDISYRIGNGRSGNIGAGALAHVIRPGVAVNWPDISRVGNPLSADGGTDPETIEEVRQYAPAAFHAEQFRAVTETDYAAAARKLPEVAGAVAAFRWTGSWYTVYVGIDPRDPENLITEEGGRTRLAPAFAHCVRDFLTRYKLAGYDLEIRAAAYVPMELEIRVCVAPDHFRADVLRAVRDALGTRAFSDGTRGFFHPDNFSFGQDVFLSQLYAAVEAVEGVEAATIRVFRRYGYGDAGELDSGTLPIGPWEIARLDNDPNFLERGVLKLSAAGGK